MQTKVLVMDDDRILLDIMEKVLSEENFEVLKTDSSSEVVKLFKKHKPDIVLLDVLFERLETEKLLREIKKIDDSAKVILLTTFDRFFLKDIEMIGVNHVLRKPFRMKELIYTIKNLLNVQERDMFD